MTRQKLIDLLCYNFPILPHHIKITSMEGEVYIVIDTNLVSSQSVNCFLKKNAPLSICWRVVTDFYFPGLLVRIIARFCDVSTPSISSAVAAVERLSDREIDMLTFERKEKP